MSGIAGIIDFRRPPLAPDLLDQLLNAMAMRGPDARSSWVSGALSLGHCLLRTTPESLNEQQPLVSVDRQHVLVWDGRLDNREELLSKLDASELRNSPDSELVLLAYRAWGEACAQTFLGDFAFALWDGQRRQLFCARDPVGGRPLFFMQNDRCFAFCSTEHALLNIPGVALKPNADRLASCFVPEFYACLDPGQSWLQDVYRLLPGETLSIDIEGRMRRSCLPPLKTGDELKFADWEECQEAFLEVFTAAVQCRLRAINPPGILLSGGLDSAAAAASMRRQQPANDNHGNFTAYSAVSDVVEECIESRSIYSVISRLDFQSRLLNVPSMEGCARIEVLRHVFNHHPHPVNSSIPLNGVLCHVAHQDGQRVMFSGVNGDLAMDFPTDYPARLIRAGEWRLGWQECRSASRNNTYMRGRSPLHILARSTWSQFAPDPIARGVGWLRSLPSRHRSAQYAAAWINPDFAQQVRLTQRLQEARGNYRRPGSRNCQDLQLKLYYPFGLMTGMEGYDRVAANYSIEMRDPWSDMRVLDFFLRLPLRYRVRKGWTKPLVRSQFAPDLGELVVGRIDKSHVGWNLIDRIVADQRNAIEARLKSSGNLLGPYVEVGAIERLLQKGSRKDSFEITENLYRLDGLVRWLDSITGISVPKMV